MKHMNPKKIVLILSIIFTTALTNTINSQKWLDRVERKVDNKINQKEREAERKVDQKIDNKIDKGIDELFSGKWLKKDRSEKYPTVDKVQNSKAGKEIVKIEQNIEDFYENYEKGNIEEAAKNIDNVDNYLLKAKSKDSEYDYSEYETEQVKMNGLLFGNNSHESKEDENAEN